MRGLENILLNRTYVRVQDATFLRARLGALRHIAVEGK